MYDTGFYAIMSINYKNVEPLRCSLKVCHLSGDIPDICHKSGKLSIKSLSALQNSTMTNGSELNQFKNIYP